MFILECKAILKSIIYFAFIAVVVLFYTTQLGNFAGNDIDQYKTHETQQMNSLSNNPLIAPVPGQDNYGYKNAEIPEQVMPNAIAELVSEYSMNEFSSYSTGLYRNKKLSPNQLTEIKILLTQMSGISVDELLYYRTEKVISDSNTVIIFAKSIDFSEVIPIVIGYDEFKKNMEYIDRMIGGGSNYAMSSLKQYGSIAISYEEKLDEHNDFLNKDKITGAYARLFCDYMGIVIALFSIFVPVSFLLRDNRAKMNELIYSRKKSSEGMVLTRYFALVSMTILPFLLLSLIPMIQLSQFALQNNMNVDYFAFVIYIFTWLMPTVLTTTAIAYFFTTLTDTPLAILIQIVWSLFGLFSGLDNLEGGYYGTEMAIRHNSLGNLHLVQENINALIANRLSYTVISIILVLGSICLYNLKRGGRFNGFIGLKKIIRNR